MPWVAPTATLTGDVSLGAESSVWHGAVLRADLAAIVIGRQSNVQDNCVLHTDKDFPTIVGDRVVIGHGAIVHGATIGDEVTVGMGAVVMNGARVGAQSYIGGGAVLTEGLEVPPRSVVLGVPAKVRRAATNEDVERTVRAAMGYVDLARAALPARD